MDTPEPEHRMLNAPDLPLAGDICIPFCIVTDGTIRFVNPSLAALLKHGRDGCDDLSFVSVFHMEGSDGVSELSDYSTLSSVSPGKFISGSILSGDKPLRVRLCFFPVKFRGGDAHLVIINDDTKFQRSLRTIREYEREIRKLGAELLSVEERQRRQIAMELHDGITQSLAVIRMQLSALLRDLEQPVLAGQVEEIRSLVDETIEDTRRMVFELSPPVLYGLSFEHVLRDLAEEFEHRYPLSIGFTWIGESITLDDDIQVFLFRTVRELLMNVIKHAEAQKVDVVCRCSVDRIEIEVTDNGKGFSTETGNKRNGFGLMSIRERTYSLGGKLRIDSCPTNGTSIRLNLPLQKKTGSGNS